MWKITIMALLTFVCVCCKSSPPKTSANATLAEVSFLDIPLAAKDIHYWDDGHSKIVKFKISESEFRKIFPNKAFKEISEPVRYEGDKFGDPMKRPNVPNQGSEIAETGLIYQKIEDDGGGETIIYDRAAGIAYYDFAPW